MKKIILGLLIGLESMLTFGQHRHKSITDTVFQLEQAEVREVIKKKVDLVGLNVPLRFVPITVTTLSSEMLERKGITEFSDAVRFLPGITEKPQQYGQFQNYSIRGMGSAVIMIDGIRDERTVGNNVPYGDLASMEKIELLKGPASVLAGHSAMGGVINMVRMKPTHEFTANARLAYGSWNERQATLGFSGRLAGPFDYRVNVHYSTGDGWRKVNADRFSGLAALAADFGKKGRFDASVGFADDDYTTEIGAAPVMPGDVYSVADDKLFAKYNERNPMADYREVYQDLANNYMKRRVWDMFVQYTLDITDWMKLKERFTYSHSNLDYHCIENLEYRISEDPIYNWYYKDKKGTNIYIDVDSVQRGNLDWPSPLNFNPDHKDQNNVLELTGDAETGFIKHHYALGWSYSDYYFKQFNGYGDDDLWGPGLVVVLPVRNPQTVQGWWDTKVSAVSLRREKANAVYLHDVFEFSDKWKMMLAGRMEFFNSKTSSATVNGKQKYEAKNRTKDWVEKKQKAFTYRAGLVYMPLAQLSFYASMSSFYTPNTRYTFNPKVIYLDRNGDEFNPDEKTMFKPQSGWSSEFGLRYTLNEILDFNASAFYILRQNMVRNLGSRQVDEGGTITEKSVQGQVGRENSYGFDAEIVARPVSTLQITAGLGYADYRVREVHNSKKFEDLGYTESKKNKRTTWTPRTTAYIFADYTVPKGVLKNLSVHLSGNFKDKVFTNLETNAYLPALWLMDAGIYYTIKQKVSLALNVNNLWNKEYFTDYSIMGKPRNFLASISYHF